MTRIWRRGAQTCRTKPLPYGIWCYLWEDSGRIALNSQTLCWCMRTACWCGGSPPPHLGNWVLRTTKREEKQTSSHTFKGAPLNSNKCVSNSLSLPEDSWIVEFIDYSHLSITLFRYLWCNHCEPPPSPPRPPIHDAAALGLRIKPDLVLNSDAAIY